MANVDRKRDFVGVWTSKMCCLAAALATVQAALAGCGRDKK